MPSIASAAPRSRPRTRPARPVLLALEGPRAALEASSLLPAWPLLRSAPGGDGHPVLVLPGFVASDASTRPLREYLRDRGYSPHGWGLGRNLGLGAGGVAGAPLRRLRELADRYGRTVSLVGWSLGGIYARELAKLAPNRVRQVITLGSPFGGEGRGHDAGWLHEMLFGEALPASTRHWRNKLLPPPPVPSTAVYSRSDGIAGWRPCRELDTQRTDNIEVVSSHCGLGFHPLVLYAIADRLAQPEGQWKPFDRSGLRRAFYR